MTVKKYFGMTGPQFQALLKPGGEELVALLDQPRGGARGWAWDGEEAWAGTVLPAYREGTFWVGVMCAHTSGFFAFPSPVRKEDVGPVVQVMCPGVSRWVWYADTSVPIVGFPWKQPMVFTAVGQRLTFFAYLASTNAVYVGGSARVSSRMGHMRVDGMKVALLGVCRKSMEACRGALTQLNPKEDGWYIWDKKAARRIAKWCSFHVRRRLQKGELHPAPRKVTKYRKGYYEEHREHILQYQKERLQRLARQPS